MQIKLVNECGFERIYNALGNIKTMQFGEGLDLLMKHLSINFYLKDVSALELVMLRTFASKIKVVNKNYSDNTSLSIPQNVRDAIKNTRQLAMEIESDIDVDVASCPHLGVPISTIRYDVMVSFEGMGVTAITGLMFKALFRDDSPNAQSPYYSEYPKDKIGDILSKAFLKEFYSYMGNKLNTIDVTSQFQLQTNFFNNMKNVPDKITLSHVNTFAGSINFVNTPEGLTEQINTVKLVNARNQKLNICSDMDYFFALRTSIFTFVILRCLTDLVVSEESLLPLKSICDVDLPADILNKYGNRINESISEIITYRDSLSDTDPNKYLYLISGQDIMYNIKVNSETNIDDILNKISSIESVYSDLQDIFDYIKYTITNLNTSIPQV